MARLIQNGVLVYRLWDDGFNELLAIFQYGTDAADFCAQQRAEDAPYRLVSVNTFNGEMHVHRPCAQIPTEGETTGEAGDG